MLFPKKVDYGLRLLIYLALQPNGVPVSASIISKRQAIPKAFLVQIFNTFQKSGIVESRRGAHGGHMLAKPPEQITVRKVFETFDRTVAPMDCLHAPQECTLSAACSQRELWGDIENMLLEILGKTSVADLAKKQRILTATFIPKG